MTRDRVANPLDDTTRMAPAQEAGPVDAQVAAACLVVLSGSNVGDHDDYRSSCGGMSTPPNGGRDAVYYIDLGAGALTSAVDVTFSTECAGTDFDTVLAVGVGPGSCGATGFGAGPPRCNDDVNTSSRRSRVTVCVPGAVATTGTRVNVLVDGYLATDVGNYQLNVVVSQHPGGTCP